ncbi:asl1 [Symbiodinium natans]|uniref:Asl1 protein n=1 Tax=Symbiodinium natans TaxID=878477 RepID=A0A812J9Q0_9DINO|nr:asl1 [Symbiodinium natans]
MPDEDLVRLPLQDIWEAASSAPGLAKVARAVCRRLGNRTFPALLEAFGNGSLQEATDRACGFPCQVSSGMWEAVDNLTMKERIWLGFMVVQLRNGSFGQGNGSCRRSPSPPRMLVHVRGARGQGLGNLLQGLEQSLHVAMVSGRAFRMKWPKLEEGVQPRFLNWKDAEGEACKPEKNELWNFGKFQEAFRPTMTMAHSNISVMHLTGNWGMLPRKWGNLSGIGLPDIDIRVIFPRNGQAAGCLLHFAMGARDGLLKDVERALGGKEPGQFALQLRTGDAVKHSISGDGRDKRPVIVNKIWGLETPSRAANAMAECFRQLCAHLFPRPLGLRGKGARRMKCVGYFETDNYEARRAIQALPMEPATALRASGLDPKHSAGETATVITLASILAMAAHDTLLKTSGSVAELARHLGPAIRPAGRSFSFETFLKERARQNRSKAEVAGLCDPALQTPI